MKIFLLTTIMLFQGIFLLANHSNSVLRALIVGDTITPESKIATQHNVWRMQKNLEVTARTIGCPLQHVYRFRRPKLTTY